MDINEIPAFERGMNVSVTIPVFNAAEFVRQAVESVLIQPEVVEVVLVEDSSTDASWEVCQKLAVEYPKIHLYRHPDGKNHGCSASRNLAVQRSTCEYIAFLDADDFYLPNRFKKAKQMFEADSELDGVYEAIQMYVEDEASLQRWKKAGRAIGALHTVTKRVLPEDLFSVLVNGGSGSFTVDGLVLKRTVFDKIGFFNQDLPLHMDDIFFIKAAALAKLMPGSLDKPVAMWRVHDHNRISAQRPKSMIYKMKLIFWYTLWEWSLTRLTREQQRMLMQALVKEAKFRLRFDQPFPGHLSGLQQRIQLLLLPFNYPKVMLQSIYWRAFLISPDFWLGKLRK